MQRETKTETVQVRVTPSQRERIVRLATAEGRPVSEWLRELALKAERAAGPRRTAAAG